MEDWVKECDCAYGVDLEGEGARGTDSGFLRKKLLLHYQPVYMSECIFFVSLSFSLHIYIYRYIYHSCRSLLVGSILAA